MAQVDDHANAVHLDNRLLAKAGQSLIVFYIRAAAHGAFRIVGDLQYPQAQLIGQADLAQVAIQTVGALGAHDKSQLALGLGGKNIRNGFCNFEFVRDHILQKGKIINLVHQFGKGGGKAVGHDGVYHTVDTARQNHIHDVAAFAAFGRRIFHQGMKETVYHQGFGQKLLGRHRNLQNDKMPHAQDCIHKRITYGMCRL